MLYEEIYDKRVRSAWDKSSNDKGRALDQLKNEITDAYAKGKISEQQYKLLNEKISDSKNNQQYNNNQLVPPSQTLQRLGRKGVQLRSNG